MLQGVFIPLDAEPAVVRALERFAEQLIEPVADLMWDGESDPALSRAALAGEAERIMAEEVRRFLTYGNWRD